ncbi:unnamed protein product [Allacma fusca]|uniref:Protein kinase domain-containing protein n=1 Tax=Allacma fusca TaxID=39272 RepID=A0A8J2JN72_9HEXA|nr:unnamed protein product [Allacma fusca]
MKRQKYSSVSEETSMSTSTYSTGNTTMVQNGGNLSITYRELNVEENFDIVKTLAEGCFAKLILVKKNLDKMVLKAVHCELTSGENFTREMNYNYFLSPHQNIVTSFNVSFFWNNCYVYVQEYAPYGDLSRFVKKGGLPESQVKLIAKQLCSAIEFIHSVHLVHRDLKLENVLVFKPNFSLVKLCDFGYTRLEGTLVTKTNQTWIPFAPPEICQVVHLERYYCHSSSDVWQVGIILCVCLTGTSPWHCADIPDPIYRQYTDWHRRKSLRMPEKFKPFTPRLTRLLKRLLEPKPSKRSSICEVSKYLKDDWIRRGLTTAGSNNSRILLERRESTSTAARHSHKLSKQGTDSRASSKTRGGKFSQIYGLEMDVDKKLLSERVVDWIASSSSSSSGSV